MLCEYCNNFDLDALVSLVGYRHHTSYSDLVNAAAAGCTLCDAVHVEHEGKGGNFAGRENGSQSTSAIICSLGLASCRLQWEWQSMGRSMTVAMAVSSVPGDASEMVINATPICADASSESCFKIISTWVEKCLAEHSVCSQESKSNRHQGGVRLLPSGIIDLGGGGRRKPVPGAGAMAFRMAILSEPHEFFNPDDGNDGDDDDDDDSHVCLHGKFEESDSETDNITRSKYRKGSPHRIMDVGSDHTDQSGTSKHQKRSLPSRVIDVGKDNADPFLLIAKNQSGTWIALSHCWGHRSTLTTDTKTLEQRKSRIPMGDFPPTFRDAVLITRRLGYQYLWIDSLCIVQDSPEDWLAESAKMGYIYKHASLTIAAEAGADSKAGIFESTNKFRSQLTTIEVPYYRKGHTQREMMYVQRLLNSASEARGPLSERAWTLQEDLLSPRTLRFASQQVWWRCREMQCNERDRGGISLDSQWNSHDTYQVAVGQDQEDVVTSRREPPNSDKSSDVESKEQVSEDESVNASDGNETDSEDGFADSDDESGLSDEFAFWTPGRLNTDTTRQTVIEEQPNNSAGSVKSLSLMSPPPPPEKSKAEIRQKRRARKVGPGTPELPDDDVFAGTLDEDRALEAAYVSTIAVRNNESRRIIPQDIDPSFPKSDSEEEIMLDEEQATYIDRKQVSLSTTASQDILFRWYNIVNDFASRKITYHSDKLPAIAGLAREIGRMTGHRYSYKAGIWRSREFEYQDLLWGITVPEAARYTEYIAPSWSWASIDLSRSPEVQSRMYNDSLFRDIRPRAEVKGMFTTTVKDDPYMQVLDGHLKIEGSCRHLCSCEVPSVFFDIHDGLLVAPTGPWDMIEAISSQLRHHNPGDYSKVFTHFRYDLIGKTFCEAQAGSDKHRPLLLLEVAEWSSPRFRAVAGICLILKSAEWDISYPHKDEVYERVGRAFILKGPVKLTGQSRWQTRTLTIK